MIFELRMSFFDWSFRYKRFIERNLSFLQGRESGGEFLGLQRDWNMEALKKGLIS